MVLNGAAHITGTIVGALSRRCDLSAPAWLLVITAFDCCRSALHPARTASRDRSGAILLKRSHGDPHGGDGVAGS
jgi:hypothetical protein